MNLLTTSKEGGKAMSQFFALLVITVMLSVSCFSGGLQAQTIEIEDLLGKTQSFESPQIQVFPNPSTGDVTIRPAEKSKITRLKVIDNFGTVLYDLPVNGRMTIPHNLSQGTYLFEVHSENGVFRKRIVFINS